jgi:hypothetical protein
MSASWQGIGWAETSPLLVSGVRMKRKSAMAFPIPSQENAQSHGGAYRAPLFSHASTPRAFAMGLAVAGAPAHAPQPGVEMDHQLEKLEFALAVAMTRGDANRVQVLRDQIAALGGNCEEPGT